MASIISAGTTSGTSLNLSGDTSGVLQLATNGSTTAVTITTAQNVGIGTGSPSKLLDVAGNAAITGTGVLSLQRPIVPVFGQGTPQLVFQYYTTGTTYTTGAQIQAIADGSWSSTSAPTNMLFYTCPSASTTIAERMRIDSSGNVGIGLTSPTSRLTVRTADGDGISIQNAAGTAYRWAVNGDGSFSCVNTGIAERLRINTNGNLILQGATSSANGIGVTFPATQSASSDANTLDDYEEGSWTPVDGSGAGLTFVNAIGKYVKIGRQVTAWGYFAYPSTANGNNSLIDGLPFTASADASARAGGMIGYSSETTFARILGPGGSNSCVPYTSAGGRITNATFSGDELYICLTYYV